MKSTTTPRKWGESWRLVEHLIQAETDECILWPGARRRTGYGNVWHEGRAVGAHRLAYELAFGPITTSGLFVCHRCDVPACINPRHLFLGTPADNSADATSKGRMARGERHGVSKLTAAQVFAIRADPRSQRVIADEFGIEQTAVSHIKRGSRWGWLTSTAN